MFGFFNRGTLDMLSCRRFIGKCCMGVEYREGLQMEHTPRTALPLLNRAYQRGRERDLELLQVIKCSSLHITNVAFTFYLLFWSCCIYSRKLNGRKKTEEDFCRVTLKRVRRVYRTLVVLMEIHYRSYVYNHILDKRLFILNKWIMSLKHFIHLKSWTLNHICIGLAFYLLKFYWLSVLCQARY